MTEIKDLKGLLATAKTGREIYIEIYEALMRDTHSTNSNDTEPLNCKSWVSVVDLEKHQKQQQMEFREMLNDIDTEIQKFGYEGVYPSLIPCECDLLGQKRAIEKVLKELFDGNQEPRNERNSKFVDIRDMPRRETKKP